MHFKIYMVIYIEKNMQLVNVSDSVSYPYFLENHVSAYPCCVISVSRIRVCASQARNFASILVPFS